MDSNGLPLLNNSRILIKGEGSLSSSFSKEFSSAEGVSLLLPVGDTVSMSLKVLTPSAFWSSTPLSFTVEPGVNALSVKLSKKISGLNNLLFTQTEGAGSGATSYNLTLYMDGKSIDVSQSINEEYVFARDSKGRLYVRYKDGDTYIVRYTSEGVKDKSEDLSLDFLANDYTTGKLYGLELNLVEVDEALPHIISVSGAPAISAPFAADNGIFAWADLGPSCIYLWKDGMTSAAQGNFSTQANTYGLGLNDGFKVKDLFIRGGYVYVLLACVKDVSTSDMYSLGAVLKWKMGTDASGMPRFEGNPEIIGKSVGRPVTVNKVLPNYDYGKNFYGAVKVIGFDDENLYIADDGFDAAYTDDYPRIVKNRNRIAVLNMNTNELTFTDAGPAKWYNEWNEWKGTKTIVWDRYREYYQVETGAENPLPPPFAEAGKQLTDVFCYDAAGNLYIADAPYGTNKQVYRFMLKDDGSYDQGVPQSISLQPEAMAVSVSSVEDDAGKTILFYYKESFTPNPDKINRLAWDTDDFNNSASKTAIILTDLGSDALTALAANKDGIFAAVKTVTYNGANTKYKIEVRKYAHQKLDLSTEPSIQAVATVTVVSETLMHATLPDEYINENLNALYIKDGILYGLTTKQKGKVTGSGSTEVFIGGKLVKIGETASFGAAGSSAVTLYEKTGFTPETSGEFAPYRFIAIKPKKLVIASEGYYGKVGQDEKIRNKVFVFDIGNWAHPSETLTQADFSKSLSYCNGFYWQ